MGFTMFVHCGCEEPEVVYVDVWNGKTRPPELIHPPVWDGHADEKGFPPASNALVGISLRGRLCIGAATTGRVFWAQSQNLDTSNWDFKKNLQAKYKKDGEHYRLFWWEGDA